MRLGLSIRDQQGEVLNIVANVATAAAAAK